MKFHENSSSGSQLALCGELDRHDVANRGTSNIATAPIKRRNSEKNASRCHVIRQNFPIDYPGAETLLHVAKGAFNCLNHGTVWYVMVWYGHRYSVVGCSVP